jgi:small subunit ribosomal protein S1
MDDFKDELAHSFKSLTEGDIIRGTVIDVSETEITLDLNYYTDGVISLEECSEDPSFIIKDDIKIGEKLSAMILEKDNEEGSVVLSLKKANAVLLWKEFKNDMEEQTVFSLKIAEVVNKGVVVYLKGIRGFIPASQLSLEYIEDLNQWLGKTIDVVIITANEENQKLVLSGKAVAKEKALLQRSKRINRLTPGTTITGTIERIESYGVFVNIGEGLTGLVHISQITDTFIKSPNEVVKLGDVVNVKILNIEGERISLSIKAASENVVNEETEDILYEYHDKEEDEPSGYMANLQKDIKL